MAKRINVKHVVFHLDCCHAGGIFAGGQRGGVEAEFAWSQVNKPCVKGMTAVTAAQEALEEPGANGQRDRGDVADCTRRFPLWHPCGNSDQYAVIPHYKK